MTAATDTQLLLLQRLILSRQTTANIQQELIMSELSDLQAQVQQTVSDLADAKADAARHEASTNSAIGLIQALTAKIAELIAAGVGATPADLAALSALLAPALADSGAANTQRDAADAALDAAVVAGTPAP